MRYLALAALGCIVACGTRAGLLQGEELVTDGTLAPPTMGVCIRCERELKADPTHPYCKECYTKWKQYENAEYEEKFCHLCGKANRSTMRKPTCYECFKSFKDVLSFTAA